MRYTPVSAQGESKLKNDHTTSQSKIHQRQEETNNLHRLEVDVLQVTVVEVEVTAVALLISELHQV